MEEIFLLLVVVRDEAEAFVAHDAFDCSARHPVLLDVAPLLVSSDILPLSYTNTPAVAFIFRAGKQWNVRELH